MKVIESIIESVKPSRSYSRVGNPAYTVHLRSGHTLRTETDGAVAYEINNPEYRGVPVRLDLVRGAVSRIRVVGRG